MIFEEKNIDNLLDGCLSGNETAQKQLFKLFFGYGKSICLRYASNREDAEEVLNDGFMKVFKNLQKYDRSKSFKAWFRTILVNTCIDYYRKKEKLTYDFDDAHYEVHSNDTNIIDSLAAEDILAMVQGLTPSYRTVFIMYAIDGYSHKEIAESLGINEVTSRTNFMKARLKLQLMIKANFPKLYTMSLNTKLHEN